jgi:hypothetical protein
MRACISLSACLALAACGTSPSSDPDSGTPPIDTGTTPEIDSGTVSPLDRATVTFGPDPIAVAQERTVCIVVDAGNDVARQVASIRTTLPQGSHHMILYRTDRPLQATPQPCFPFAEGGDVLFVAQMDGAELVYPPDAAVTFTAHQHVRIEIHEVNYLGMPIEITASATFELVPLGAPTRAEVHWLFTGDMSISLPPRTMQEITSFHDVPPGARLFGLTSHTHALGTYASIHRADGTGAPLELLHESTNWAEPPLTTFAPPLVLGIDEGLLLTCRFHNTTDATVSFGLDFDEEMCFLWAYWY